MKASGKKLKARPLASIKCVAVLTSDQPQLKKKACKKVLSK